MCGLAIDVPNGTGLVFREHDGSFTVGMAAAMLTKTGIILGMGEEPMEVRQAMADLREAAVDILTLGQYLRPTPEQVEVELHVRFLEVEARLFKFVLVIHVAVSDSSLRTVGPDQIENAFNALQIHRDALEAVGDLSGHGPALEPAHLLEVGELGDFHPIQPDLPAQAPCAQSWGFPVVLDKPNIMLQGIDTQGLQRTQIKVLDFDR